MLAQLVSLGTDIQTASSARLGVETELGEKQEEGEEEATGNQGEKEKEKEREASNPVKFEVAH